jgi:hypothetical protein
LREAQWGGSNGEVEQGPSLSPLLIGKGREFFFRPFSKGYLSCSSFERAPIKLTILGRREGWSAENTPGISNGGKVFKLGISL